MLALLPSLAVAEVQPPSTAPAVPGLRLPRDVVPLRYEPRLTIDPALEQALLEGLRTAEGTSQLLLPPAQIDSVLTAVTAQVTALQNEGTSAVLSAPRRCDPR